MQRYVIVENIRRFHEMLEKEQSPDKRKLLEDLLHEEERKLAELSASPASATPPRA